MATKQGKKDNRLSDKEALHIAETTDVSPGQAKELAKKHGKDKAKEEAKTSRPRADPIQVPQEKLS